jgi:acetylornithine/succinyldiaminopimelate/putrescine aminotransferase
MSKRPLHIDFYRHVAQTSDNPLGIVIQNANGIYLHAEDKTYIDCISGISVSALGHSHPSILAAIQQQLNKHLHLMVYGELIQDQQVALATALAAMLPESLQSVYFVNSGSEAIEGAMKLAKRYTKRSKFVAQKLAYHGSTQGALSLMSDAYFSQAFAPLLPGIDFIEQNQIDQIEALITQETAAVFVEPVMGEKGYVPCSKAYLYALRKRCNETGTLLVFDEIQTAYGRTGEWFAFQSYGVVPDVLVLAKSFGGGLPLGAFIASTEIMECLKDHPVLGHITTFGGHPLSCAAALAAIKVLQTELHIEQVNTKSNLFRDLLKHPKIISIDGMGLMLALQFEQAQFCRKVIDQCVQNGLLIDWFLYAEDKIRLAPPLIVSIEQIHEISHTILKSIDECL